MDRLEQLYKERQQLNDQKVSGVAGSQARHFKIKQIQKEIDYFELGDTISRTEIQAELAEIQVLQEEINRLTAELYARKTKLKNDVFGEHTTIYFE